MKKWFHLDRLHFTFFLMMLPFMLVGLLFLYQTKECVCRNDLKVDLEKIADRTYEEGHNCLDASKELEGELERSGIASDVIVGDAYDWRTGEMERHAWVAIWVEPQTGRFIGPLEDYESLKLLKNYK